MNPPKDGTRVRFRLGFSLLEVVVAIGIFASGVVTVVGLFGALAKSVGTNAEATIAANLGDLLQQHLQARVAADGALDSIATRFSGTSESPMGPLVLYASREGTKIGEDAPPAFTGGTEKFFAITLYPVLGAETNSALLLPYIAEVRWPAAARVNAIGVPLSSASQQQVFLLGAVGR